MSTYVPTVHIAAIAETIADIWAGTSEDDDTETRQAEAILTSLAPEVHEALADALRRAGWQVSR